MISLLSSYNSSVRIFTGRLASTTAGPLDQSFVPVICKLSYVSEGMGRLAWEALIYHDLHDLQGKVIPRSYGFFEDQGYASCLVLEYAGKPLDTCFGQLNDSLK